MQIIFDLVDRVVTGDGESLLQTNVFVNMFFDTLCRWCSRTFLMYFCFSLLLVKFIASTFDRAFFVTWLFPLNLNGSIYESFSYLIVSCWECFFSSLSIPLLLPGKASRKNQKWRGPDENIRANLRQYGLEKFYLDALVADSSRPIWRKGMLFDAIITDRKFVTAFSCPMTVTKTLLPVYID